MLAAYVGLTVVMTWPLAVKVGQVVPKDLGDPLFSIWALWWNARVLPFSEAWWQAPIFYPGRDAMTLADHRVGLGPLTTPVLWAGASPVAAYDVAFLASFVLSAAAAYALCRGTGTSRAAAFVGGLVFGFHPFRAAHLEHLELLSAYWLPLTLVCLHRWTRTRSRLALAVVAASLLGLALTSGYYYFYSAVLIAGWTVWFGLRGTTWRHRAELAVAFVAPLALLAPILWRYRDAHRALGLSRSITEIEQLSADVSSFWAPPGMLAWWPSGPPTMHPELALFPGLTAVGLVALALWRTTAGQPDLDGWRRFRLCCAALAGALALAGVVATVAGPFGLSLGPLRLSVSNLYKPFSVAAMLGLAAALTLPRVRAAWTTRSTFAFYVLATLGLWVLTLGPTARFLGERILYKAPYAWLMVLPGFSDEFRAPARFAMLAALTLAVAAALAADRFAAGLTRSQVLALWIAAAGGVAADGWLDRLPLPAPPESRPATAALAPEALVLELPLGAFEDLAAMYRSIGHGRGLVNGYSGYDPAHYTVLRGATAAGRFGAIPLIAGDRDLAVVVRASPEGQRLVAALQEQIANAESAAVGGDLVVTIPRARLDSVIEGVPAALPIVGLTASSGNPERARDGDPRTAWQTASPQAGGEQLVVDLGEVRQVGRIELSLGPMVFAYPRDLVVQVSTDGVAWTEAWHGDTTVVAMRAALASPAEVPMRLDVAATSARYVRLTQLGTALQPWAVAELVVRAPAP